MNGGPPEISVVTPFDPAISRVKRVLFQPFDLSKWFVIGFCAWLAHLLDGGFQGNFGGPFQAQGNNGPREMFDQAKTFVVDNWAWIVPVAVVAILVSIAIWLVCLWVSSRGQFMFLHCVAQDKAEVAEPWRRYSELGNSLFRFRLTVSLLFTLFAGAPVAAVGLILFKTVDFNRPSVGAIVGIVAAALFLAAAALGLFVLLKFTKDFVAPIMYLRGARCTKAWVEFLQMLGSRPGTFILYLLFQIVLAILSFLVMAAAFVVTCCIACCVAAIPYIGTVLLLPIIVFGRSYSLYFLAQFGPRYDVFQAPAAETPR